MCEGKLEEKRSTLRKQLIIKLGAVSNCFEVQLSSEEDVLRIIHKNLMNKAVRK